MGGGAAVTTAYVVGLVVAIGLFAYFLAAMLFPERF
jgi:K+-transporting ATPase KdpF subunit